MKHFQKITQWILAWGLLTLSMAGEAENILKQSAEIWKKSSGWSIDFTATTKAQDGSVGQAKGHLNIGQGDQFHLILPGQQVVSDGKNLWQFTPAKGQVMIRLVADQKGSTNPSEVLFRYLRCKPLTLEKVKQGKTETYHLKLDPQGQVKGMSSIEVWLKVPELTPISIVSLDKTGAQTIYQVSMTAKQHATSEFQFITPKGVEEIDMR